MFRRSFATTVTPLSRAVLNQRDLKTPLAPLAAPTSVLPEKHVVDPAGLLAKCEDMDSREWSVEEIATTLRETHLVTWGATGAVDPLQITKGEGVYFWDTKGDRYMDFNSGAMCANLGHTTPEPVIQAIEKQLREVAYAYPCHTTVPIKAKLGELMKEILPGDLNHFFYTCGGAESNEAALRMAKIFTGRSKVMARYRSYHGGSAATMALTGDPRRWAAEPAMGNVIRVFDPDPYHVSFGMDEEEITHNNLTQLREVIKYEGGHNIMAFFVESITGTNGILAPPKGYLEGVRAICDEHGILMVCDEVMNGFWRTGEPFGFMHSDTPIVPDMVTMAKGINGAVLPLGAVAVRDEIADYFMDHPISVGTTYNSHPVGLASAYAVLKHSLSLNIEAHVKAMEPVMRKHMQALADKHPAVRACRQLGLFGMIDLQKDSNGTPFVEYNGPPHPALGEFNKNLRENGLFTLFRWSSFMCNPPLIISESEIEEAFDIIDRSLAPVDAAFEG